MICQNNKNGGYYNAIAVAINCTANTNDQFVVYAADSAGASLLAFIARAFGVRLFVRQLNEFESKFKVI